jgi:hypothetical protein
MDRIHRMSRGRKTLLSLLLVGALGAVAGIGTFSAFSATTVNAGNTFDAGTVVLTDNDSNTAMYNIVDAEPNDVVVRCIRVTYSGSLASTVRLYTTTPVNAFGQYVTLSIDKGTMPAAAFPTCNTFSSESTIFSGTLSSFAAGNTNWATGAPANPGVQTQWNQNDSLVYRFTLTMQDNPAATGGTSGTHSFTWEAQNV